MKELFSGSWVGVCQWVTPFMEWQMSQETLARGQRTQACKAGALDLAGQDTGRGMAAFTLASDLVPYCLEALMSSPW